MRPKHEMEEVKRLLAGGLTHREMSTRTGVPLNTIRHWLYQGFPPRGGVRPENACPRCGAEAPGSTISHRMRTSTSSGSTSAMAFSARQRPGATAFEYKGKAEAYPRYQFSNRSDDIRRIFTDACDSLGVEWRPWTRWHISVARKDSVALLDEFIGLKE
jgi:hypothetical protein